MLLILDPAAGPGAQADLQAGLARLGLEPHPAGEGALGLLGPSDARTRAEVARLPGVRKVVALAEPYRLVSRAFHPEPTRIPLGAAVLGGREVVMMAGPCAVEHRDQILEAARRVQAEEYSAAVMGQRFLELYRAVS